MTTEQKNWKKTCEYCLQVFDTINKHQETCGLRACNANHDVIIAKVLRMLIKQEEQEIKK
jgi:hypothetical protein